MDRKPIRWGAAIAWLVTGMIIAFVAFAKLTPHWKAAAVAAPGAGSPAPALVQSAAAPAGAACDARGLSLSLVQVAARLKPAVVKIAIEKKSRGEAAEGPLGADPFDFFRHFQGRGGGKLRPMIQQGVGSGFILDKEGHILTNNHVVEGADRVTVEMTDGRQLKGTVIGADAKDDLAVVKIEGNLSVQPVSFGDSEKLQPGELVMAIGAPLGLDQTVTVGVVSAKGRRLDGNGNPYAFEDFIQTDAAINHGNSGGPLVNMNGEVVGVNSRIADPGAATGIGFSVSSNVARRVAMALIKDGRVRRPYIGVNLKDLTADMAPFFKTAKGVVVQDVVPQSPAAKAGIEAGDVITTIDGKEIEHSDQIVRTVQSHQVGQQVRLGLVHNGGARQLTLAAAEAPDEGRGRQALASGGGGRGHYGLKLDDLTPQIASELGLKGRRGAVVMEVEPGSAADHAGLDQGDVVVEVDRKPIQSADGVIAALAHGGMHLLRVERHDGGGFFVTLSPEK